MKKKVFIAVLAVSGVLGLVMTSTAAAGPMGLKGRLADTPLGKFITGRIGRVMVLRSELDMTADQRKEIRTIVKSHRAEFLEVARPITEKRRALRDAVLAEVPDEAAIRAASEDLAAVIGDAAVLGATVSSEVREVLTDEQIEKIGQMILDNTLAADEFLDKMAARQ